VLKIRLAYQLDQVFPAALNMS